MFFPSFSAWSLWADLVRRGWHSNWTSDISTRWESFCIIQPPLRKLARVFHLYITQKITVKVQWFAHGDVGWPRKWSERTELQKQSQKCCYELMVHLGATPICYNASTKIYCTWVKPPMWLELFQKTETLKVLMETRKVMPHQSCFSDFTSLVGTKWCSLWNMWDHTARIIDEPSKYSIQRKQCDWLLPVIQVDTWDFSLVINSGLHATKLDSWKRKTWAQTRRFQRRELWVRLKQEKLMSLMLKHKGIHAQIRNIIYSRSLSLQIYV